MTWGERGAGAWITVYANGGHAYAVIAGLRLDTSAASVTRTNTRKFKKALERGPRWRPTTALAQGLQGPPPARLLARPTSPLRLTARRFLKHPSTLGLTP